MAWDSSRPVPWQRFVKEWVVIGLAVAAISWFVTDNRNPSAYISIALAGVVYVGFGGLLAKFGYTRKTLKELRAENAAAPPRTSSTATTASGRAKPAPTKRTSSGPSNRPNKKKR